MPAPAQPRRYAQLCGIATALDVVGDRWALLIVRDLLLGPLRFVDLVEGLPGIGTNTLTARLKDLEAAEVIQRRLLPRPDRSAVYQLTAYGRELEPILLSLGRWGTRSMGRLPAGAASRSRWLMAALLAFHDAQHRLARPMTWELRLTDGPFTVHAEGTDLRVTAGAPDRADAVITTDDTTLHRLLTHQLNAAQATATGLVTLTGDPAALPRLVGLFTFPTVGAP